MATPSRRFGFETRMLHAGHVPDAEVGARAVPIYQTTSFVFDDPETAAQLFELKQYGNIYTGSRTPRPRSSKSVWRPWRTRPARSRQPAGWRPSSSPL